MKPVRMWLMVFAGACALGGCAAQLGNGVKTESVLGIKAQAAQAYAAGQGQEALAAYQRYVEKAPDDAQAWTRIGNLQLMANQPQAAIHAYRQALSIDRTDTEAWHNLALIRLRQAHAAMLGEYNTLADGSKGAMGLACHMAWLSLLEQGGKGKLPSCKP